MNKSDLARNAYLLCGSLSKRGYMRWFHSFSGIQPETGEHRVFFIEYMIMNPSLGKSKPILGQLPYNRKRGIKPSYLQVKAGAFSGDAGAPPLQLNAYYPLTDLKVALSPLIMQFGDNFYSEQRIHGYVNVPFEDSRRRSHMSNEGCMEWDLEVYKSISCHTGWLASPFASAIGALDTFWHAEGMKTGYRGTVTLNGTPYEVTEAESYGYADKHWGRSFNRPWLQLASCDLTSERFGRKLKHSALAVNGSCPRFLFIPLWRKLLFQLTYEKEDYVFNFSPFARNCKWKLKYTDKRFVWQIAAQNKEALVKLSISSLKDELLKLHYEAPDGMRIKDLLGCGTGIGKLLLYRRNGKETELIDTISIEHILLFKSGDE